MKDHTGVGTTWNSMINTLKIASVLTVISFIVWALQDNKFEKKYYLFIANVRVMGIDKTWFCLKFTSEPIGPKRTSENILIRKW